MRTVEEIVSRIESKKGKSFFGFDLEVLISSLPFEDAKPYLKPEAKAEDWEEPTEEVVRQRAFDYLDFAYGKAADHRGLSAERSIEKLSEYAWLLGKEDVADEMVNGPFQNYGAPGLFAFARAFDRPIPDNPGLVRMAEGKPCVEDCMEGCGQ